MNNESQNTCAPFHPLVKDITGQRFGSWTVLERAEQNGKGRNARWLCRCDCGAEISVLGNALRTGRSSRCQKCMGAIISASKMGHGETGSRDGKRKQTRTYSCWNNMKSRAASNQTLEARKYAKRDISISQDWAVFENFVRDMGHCPSNEHSLDRINNDLGYNKENCRWATHTEQQRNKSSNRIVEYNGEKMCVAEFAERIGISGSVARARVRAGWSIDRIVHTPVK